MMPAGTDIVGRSGPSEGSGVSGRWVEMAGFGDAATAFGLGVLVPGDAEPVPGSAPGGEPAGLDPVVDGADAHAEPFGGVGADGPHADVVELCRYRHSWTYADPVTMPMPLFGAGGFASVGAAVECGALGSGRHIYRLSRNASIRSGGRYLPDCGDIGVSWASARSLMARSACR